MGVWDSKHLYTHTWIPTYTHTFFLKEGRDNEGIGYNHPRPLLG